MLYLLDASVLITAHNLYYPIDGVPEYWEWLLHVAKQGRLKMPLEIYEEIKEGPDNADKDLLFAWVQTDVVRDALILSEDVKPDLVQKVVEDGYAPDLTDDEIEEVGRDPFLIAYALANPVDRVLVTVEASKPSRTRANRHIPDVCKSLGIQSLDPFHMNKALGFRTNWKSP